MSTPKLSHLPLFLITIFLLAHKIATQPRLITNLSSTFPHHMYKYDRYMYNNLRVSLHYQYEVASCFQIWLYQDGSNLAGQPYYKSDTNCGNFVIAHSWNNIRYFQVKAIQLKEPRVDYTLLIYQFPLWSYQYPTPRATFTSTMLQQFPNLPVVTVNPYVSSLFFEAPEAYFVYQTSHSSQTMAYFVSETGQAYCLRQSQYSQVYTKISNGMNWTFVANLGVDNTSRIISIFYNITIYVNERLNGSSQPVYWDAKNKKCTAHLPSPNEEKKLTQYFLFLCKIGLIAILVLFDVI